MGGVVIRIMEVEGSTLSDLNHYVIKNAVVWEGSVWC